MVLSFGLKAGSSFLKGPDLRRSGVRSFFVVSLRCEVQHVGNPGKDVSCQWIRVWSGCIVFRVRSGGVEPSLWGAWELEVVVAQAPHPKRQCKVSSTVKV